ncbi:hypothetical protein [Actinokineospora sp. NPDC004072]
MTDNWAPAACTLPTAEQPLRVAEFDGLFAEALRGLERTGPTGLRIALEATPEVAARAAELVVRESQCCSFFTFTLTAASGELALAIGVPDQHADVLDAIAARASA